MNRANHQQASISTYPFKIFGKNFSEAELKSMHKGDTIIGNDVWIGYGAMFMPGVKIGNGAIIGSKAVVTKDVPSYAIVGDNPAKIIRYRFSDEKIAFLNLLNWWDWPIDKIVKNLLLLSKNEEINLKDLF